jgi:hypothetical protein
MGTTIRKGDKGKDVKIAQGRLTFHGYPVAADGVFGSGTEAKVMQFQQAKGLPSDGIVGPKTWDALFIALVPEVQPPEPLPEVLAHIKSLGFKIKWAGDNHLHLFGIRNPNAQANSFDDILGCAYTEKGLWRVHYWPGTTDPGTYYLTDKAKWFGPGGVAILAEGQYEDAYEIGIHKGYEALVQRGKLRIYLDSDLDNVLDFDPATLKDTSTAGINIHASVSDPYNTSATKTQVGAWSAGCQVHARTDGFCEMMELARKQVNVAGISKFTYTLMKRWW